MNPFQKTLHGVPVLCILRRGVVVIAGLKMRCETMVGLQDQRRNSIIEECTITVNDTMVQGSSFKMWLVN